MRRLAWISIAATGAAVLAATTLPIPGLASSAAPVVAGADTVEVRQWTVPWERTRPRDPYVAGDGKVWFVGQAGNYIARLDPAAGTFTRFEIDEGTHPHNLIVDAQGMVWYAGNRNGMIGKLDPSTGTITRYPMPDPAVRDPHTLVFGPSGEIWFTAQGANHVGRLDPKSGKIDVVAVPTPRARPYGIRMDPSGRPWFTEFGSNKIATIDPATLAIREFELPEARTRARRLAITSDGAIWYGDYTRGYLGRLDPKTGEVREWPLPSGGRSLPYAMTVDDRDRVWVAETGVQPNQLVAFDTRAGRFVHVAPVAGEPNTIRHMIFHAPSRTIWFGTDANMVGRAQVP